MREFAEFKPPQPNGMIIEIVEFFLPIYVKVVEKLSFKFIESPEHPIAFLKDKAAVVVVNHGDRQDPLVLLALEKYMRERFYFVVAREVFDWSHGLLGWFFQKVGGYSVSRGVADFQSIHTTQEILLHPPNKLVVFPEAEITADEMTVHHLGRSFVHLLLESQEKIADKNPGHALWILPVGVSYKLESTLESSISKTLTDTENFLGISSRSSSDLKDRVIVAIETVLDNLSEKYQFHRLRDKSLDEDVQQLTHHICLQLAQYLGFELAEGSSDEQMLHSMLVRIRRKLATKVRLTPYKAKLTEELWRTHDGYVRDLDRVERLLILKRVLKRPSSPIKYCRLMDFLEAEMFGRMTKKGKQVASIYIGDAIDVSPFFLSYKTSKKNAIDSLAASIQNELQDAFDKSHT